MKVTQSQMTVSRLRAGNAMSGLGTRSFLNGARLELRGSISGHPRGWRHARDAVG